VRFCGYPPLTIWHGVHVYTLRRGRDGTHRPGLRIGEDCFETGGLSSLPSQEPPAF
jgi:hypothetical protein